MMGGIAFVAYVYMIMDVGGFVEAYSRVKGGGRAGSGYVGEAVNLGLPAVVLLGLARRGAKLQPGDVFRALLFASPLLLQGTFGGRRGPLFLGLAALALGWFISKEKRPKLLQVGLVFCMILTAVMFVWSQRQHMHLGSEDVRVDTEAFKARLFTRELEKGSNFIYGSGLILTAKHTGKYTWGKSIFVNVFIRPI
ncbi:hypothetical protein OAG20_03200, partial [Verrucomicrobiales bacterium]|nr:hypothetical protein [Verrucomicrobiales bacterium]